MGSGREESVLAEDDAETCCALERETRRMLRPDRLHPVKDNFFRETADARRRMESEDVQERERLVEQNLTLDNKGGHTQLHIVKAHPVSQVL